MAGVTFNLLEQDDIRRLTENQAKVRVLCAKLKRRQAMSEWGHGEMRPIGSRSASGGRRGDGYAAYAGSMVVNQDDIRTMFAYALVCLPVSFQCPCIQLFTG